MNQMVVFKAPLYTMNQMVVFKAPLYTMNQMVVFKAPPIYHEPNGSILGPPYTP